MKARRAVRRSDWKKQTMQQELRSAAASEKPNLKRL